MIIRIIIVIRNIGVSIGHTYINANRVYARFFAKACKFSSRDSFSGAQEISRKVDPGAPVENAPQWNARISRLRSIHFSRCSHRLPWRSTFPRESRKRSLTPLSDLPTRMKLSSNILISYRGPPIGVSSKKVDPSRGNNGRIRHGGPGLGG